MDLVPWPHYGSHVSPGGPETTKQLIYNQLSQSGSEMTKAFRGETGDLRSSRHVLPLPPFYGVLIAIIPLVTLLLVWLHICETYRVSLHHLSFGVSDDHDQLSLESNNQHWALVHHLAHGQLQETHEEKLDHNDTLTLLLAVTVGSEKIIRVLGRWPWTKARKLCTFLSPTEQRRL